MVGPALVAFIKKFGPSALNLAKEEGKSVGRAARYQARRTVGPAVGSGVGAKVILDHDDDNHRGNNSAFDDDNDVPEYLAKKMAPKKRGEK